MLRSVFAVAVAFTVAGGCSDSTDEPNSVTGTASAESSEGAEDGSQPPGGPVNSCEVVTLDQLSDTLGKEVIFDPSSGGDAANCLYITKGAKTIVFSINAQPATGSADEVIGQMLDLFEDAKPIDIGEGGYILFGGSQVGFVQAGIEYQIDLGSGASAGDGGEQTIAVARLIESSV